MRQESSLILLYFLPSAADPQKGRAQHSERKLVPESALLELCGPGFAALLRVSTSSHRSMLSTPVVSRKQLFGWDAIVETNRWPLQSEPRRA